MNTSPSVCIHADIARAIGGLIWACIVILGLSMGSWHADLYLSQGVGALLVAGAFVCLIALIARSLVRAFRQAEAWRRRGAEGRGLRGRDCL